MEAPAGLDMAGVTKPYFRSGYVFVTRQGSGLEDLKSLADPRLKKLKIGVNIYTSDAENSPPAMALSRYGVVGNLTGYSTFFSDNRPARGHHQGCREQGRRPGHRLGAVLQAAQNQLAFELRHDRREVDAFVGNRDRRARACDRARRADVVRQRRRADDPLRLAAHRDGVLDGVLELTDVARPRVVHQRAHARPAISVFAGRLLLRHDFCTKCCASSGMSSRRSRSGGSVTGMTFSR